MGTSEAEQANRQMVDAMIADGSLWSPRLIRAFRATPRHRFLDRVFQFHPRSNAWHEILTRDPGPDELAILYSDRALITHLSPVAPQVPISSSSQPSLMAQMLEDLQLAPWLRVLEIGAGTGYNAALMAHVVGPGRVISIDVDRQVLSEAWEHLRAFPDREVHLHHADGRQGFAAAAPYDRIMVTAATPDLEPAWLEQLARDGLLVAPLWLAPGLAFVVRGAVRDGTFDGKLLRAAYFMPLRAEGKAGETEEQPPTPSSRLQIVPAPWATWFDRRRVRIGWQRFSQSLAFYGLLRGFGIHHRSVPEGAATFGISGPDGEGLCWFGLREWEVQDEASRQRGEELVRAFQDAGGPWPTEFRLRARADAQPEGSGAREEYVRQGPRCYQVWTLIEPRDRGTTT